MIDFPKGITYLVAHVANNVSVFGVLLFKGFKNFNRKIAVKFSSTSYSGGSTSKSSFFNIIVVVLSKICINLISVLFTPFKLVKSSGFKLIGIRTFIPRYKTFFKRCGIRLVFVALIANFRSFFIGDSTSKSRSYLPNNFAFRAFYKIRIFLIGKTNLILSGFRTRFANVDCVSFLKAFNPFHEGII